MTILDRHIGDSLVKGFLMIIMILVSFFTFLDFVEELKDVGTGLYTTADAFLTVMLTMPGRMLPLAPTAALLGCLYGLGNLRHNNEIIAMSASGLSATHVALSAMKTGAIVILVMAMALQFVVPELSRVAWHHRTMAISGSLGLHTEETTGLWFRDTSRFINVREMTYGSVPTDVEIFEFNAKGELQTFTHAREAGLLDDGTWLLKDVIRSVIDEGNILSQTYPTLSWDSFLIPRKVALLTIEPENLSLSDLHHYAQDLRVRGENADRYDLVFWQKLSVPLATGGMILIAIPFLFGSNRSTTVGHKMMVGVVVGMIFYLGNQIVSHIGVLLKWNSALTAVVPAITLIVVALLFLRRSDSSNPKLASMSQPSRSS